MAASTVRPTFVAYGKTFDHKADAESWTNLVPKVKDCDAYRFVTHLDPNGPKRPKPVAFEECAPYGLYMRFKDNSTVVVRIDGTLTGYAHVGHQQTDHKGEVHYYSSVCFLSNGKLDIC